MLRKFLYFGSKKISSRFQGHSDIGPPEYTPTNENFSPDISPGPIFGILRYIVYGILFELVIFSHIIEMHNPFNFMYIELFF